MEPRIRGYVPGGVYATANGSVQINVGSNEDFKRLCDAAARPDLLADPRYADRWLRTDHQQSLIADVEAFMRLRTTEDWLDRFVEVGLMSGPINTLAQAAADPQVKVRRMIVPTPHGAGGVVPLVGNPIKFSETPIEPFQPPPLLGEHTDTILGELGLGRDEISALRASGAIGAPCRPLRAGAA